MAASSGVALARPVTDAAAALAQERYYSSYGTPAPSRAAALSQERYYSSFGEAEPLTVPQSPAASDDIAWLPIALAGVAALAIVAASSTQVRRLRIRRRAARAIT